MELINDHSYFLSLPNVGVSSAILNRNKGLFRRRHTHFIVVKPFRSYVGGVEYSAANCMVELSQQILDKGVCFIHVGNMSKKL